MKKMISTTLAIAMLASAPMALATEVAPDDIGIETSAELYLDSNTLEINGQTVFLSALNRLSLSQRSGIASFVDSDTPRIMITAQDNENDTLVLNTDEQTLVLDAQTGDTKILSDIGDGDMICAYVSAATTMSIPPQSYAELILVNLDASAFIPMYAEIDAVDGVSGSESVTLTTDMDINFVVNEDTQISPYLTRQLITKDTLIPGQKVLAWYSSVQETSPAQADASKLLVFNTSYAGFVELRDSKGTVCGELLLNGESIAFTAPAIPYISGDTYMVPLRKIAETLGYTVTWDNETKAATVLNTDGSEHAVANTTQNSISIHLEGSDMIASMSHAGVTLQDGVTFVDLDIAIRFFDLKLAHS